jgi:cytochrome c553
MIERCTPNWSPGVACCVAFGLSVGLAPAPAQADGDRALGEHLSSECVTCHQLTGRYQGIPPIVGWPEASFIEAMNEYREKRRSNPVMQTIAGKFSSEDVAALAAYFRSVKPKN